MDQPVLPDTQLHGRRHSFADAPEDVVRWAQERLGHPLAGWQDRSGGMSTGIAAVVKGSRSAGFLKAIDGVDNPRGREAYVREAAIAEFLPRHHAIPRLLDAGPVGPTDSGVASGWWANLFEEAPGQVLRHPWTSGSLRRVLAAWDELAPDLWSTPWSEPAQLGTVFGHWSQIAADPSDDWTDLAPLWSGRDLWLTDRLAGSADDPPVLAHVDLRADNIVIGNGRIGNGADEVSFVDWAHPGLAARWIDVALLLVDVISSGADVTGGGEIDVLEIWCRHPVCAHYDPEHLICTVAGLAAMLHTRSRQPVNPRLPHRTVWSRAASTTLLPFVRRHTHSNLL